MPFQKAVSLTPATVGRIRTILDDGNGQVASRVGKAKVQLLTEDGTVVSDDTYDLAARLSGPQRQQLAAVMDMLRTEAQALLP